MKRTLAALALLLPLAAQADDFARTKAAEQLVDLMNQLDPFDAAMQSDSATMFAPLLMNMPCPEKALPDVQRTLSGVVTYSALRPFLIKTYAETFDFNELNVIRAFYQTPTGARLLKLSPQMEMTLQRHTADLLKDKLPELQKTLAAHAKDESCKAAGDAATPPAATAPTTTTPTTTTPTAPAAKTTEKTQ